MLSKDEFRVNVLIAIDDQLKAAHYSNDIEVSLGEEMVHFRSYAVTQMNSDDTKTSKELLMCRILLNDGLVETFPNVAVAFRIYLSLMVANCTGERSFSQLKRIKNESRTRNN